MVGHEKHITFQSRPHCLPQFELSGTLDITRHENRASFEDDLQDDGIIVQVAPALPIAAVTEIAGRVQDAHHHAANIQPTLLAFERRLNGDGILAVPTAFLAFFG